MMGVSEPHQEQEGLKKCRLQLEALQETRLPGLRALPGTVCWEHAHACCMSTCVYINTYVCIGQTEVKIIFLFQDGSESVQDGTLNILLLAAVKSCDV